MLFYLKINREEKYTKRNLQQWIEVITFFDNPTIVIQCDKENLKNEVLGWVNFHDLEVSWINTEFEDERLKKIVKTMAPEWEKASFAHMTTFLDIEKRENANDPGFFNIDADDTMFCMKPHRVYEMLIQSISKAEDMNVDLFSFDMWYSRARGSHWSFGVTYVRNKHTYLDLCIEASSDTEWMNIRNQPRNVDGFFNYLDYSKKLKIGSYYCENTRFIHYSNDFFRRLWTSSFYHFHNGKMYLPLFEISGMHDLSSYEIPNDDVCIDIGFMDIEFEEFMFIYTVEPDKTALMNCTNRSIEAYEKRIEGIRQNI